MIGSLIVMSGPSGAGKSTLCQPILEANDNMEFSVSCTTRQPRDGEVNGVDYHFITTDEFKSKIAKGDFLEWAEVHGNYYGTLASSVEDQILAGKDVLLDIDVQGALQIKELLQNRTTGFALIDCTSFIFIAPPSYEVLEERLVGRGTETDESLQKRLRNARAEMDQRFNYDYIVVNTDKNVAGVILESVLTAVKCKSSIQRHNSNL